MQGPLWRWGAVSLARAIREKRVSSREVIAAHLDRVRAVNPQVNAVTAVLADAALRAAEAADAKVAAGDAVGPLHGVPVTVKENIDLVGSATTQGVVALKDSLPRTDAPVVAHLKRAGAIPIGRTNMPDFGLRWHTDSGLYGATRNPWDAARTPGGSSGGEAAAIATGMSPLGVGNDMAGSLRYPAQCCGIAALRPSLGRVSRTESAIFPDPPLFYEQVASVNGPLARHVADLRLALEVMSQPDPGDPWWTPAPRLGAAPAAAIGVALTFDPSGDGCSPAVAAALRRAADALADAGYAVDEVDPPAIAEAAGVIERICDAEITRYADEIRPLMAAPARLAFDYLIEDPAPTLSSYLDAIADRHRIACEWNAFMGRYPLVLGPVSTLQPFAVGYDVAGREQMQRFVRSVRLTELCNLLGLPSAAVPVDAIDGLPQGVQLIAPRFHDDLCLNAAEVIERQHGTVTPIEPRAAPGAD